MSEFTRHDLPDYTRQDRGDYEVVDFVEPLDIKDPMVLYALCEEFETDITGIDVRDEQTVWVS